MRLNGTKNIAPPSAAYSNKVSAFVAANVRDRNSPSGTMGNFTRASTTTNATRAAAPSTQQREHAPRAEPGRARVDERVDEQAQPDRRQRGARDVDPRRGVGIARLRDAARRQRDDHRRDRDVEEEEPAPGRVRGDPAARDRPRRPP